MRTRMLFFVGIVLLMLALGVLALISTQSFPKEALASSVSGEALLPPIPTPIHPPSVTATPAPEPVPLSLASCTELISNGGFETNEDWTIPDTAYDAAYTDSVAHSGMRSVRLGIEDATRNLFSFSSVEQRVTIPSNASSARLSFWYQALHSGQALPSDTEKDYGYVLAQDASGAWHKLSVIRQAQADWAYLELGLAPFVGQTIVLRLGVYNDGQGAAMVIYLDEVSLVYCRKTYYYSSKISMPTPTLSSIPTPTPTVAAPNTPGGAPPTGRPEAPPPAPTPVPTATPTLAEGEIPSAGATPTLISTGRLEVTYPLEMIVEEADIVTVKIIADPRIAGIGLFPQYGNGVIQIERSSQNRERVRIEDEIRLYPVMSAELIAVNFDIIHGDVDTRRAITTTDPAVWTWSIAARKPGMQKITINIFGEATIGGEELSALVMSKSRNVNVVEKPLPKRILDGLVNNLVAIVSTGGPLGLILAYLTYKANQTSKSLEEKIKTLENKLKELEEAK